MPNIQTQQFSPLLLPKSCEGFTFKSYAYSNSGEILVPTTYKEKEFLLQIVPRERNGKKDFLIKAQKLTRVSPVSILQSALGAFAKLHNLSLTFSNISPQKSSIVKSNDFDLLKDEEFFINSLSYENPILVEIGFGSGRHLLYQAKQNPHKIIIGIEIHRPSIEQVIKQCKLQNIKNVYIAAFDARIFLQLLKSNSVETIFVHFPVPWDKKPHRRIISTAFLEEAIRVLEKSGQLELRTDSKNYFSYSFETFNELNIYNLQIKKNHNLPVSSKYEDRWRKMEKNIYDITFKNDTFSEDREISEELTFENNIPFKKIKEQFQKTTIKRDDHFVHFEELYEIDTNSGLIKLTFGSYEKPEHKFLLFNENRIQYFPKQTIGISQNIKSHKIIKEFFHV